MGLRTASVRHPHVMVMAPALTKANQSQSFKLSPKNPTQSATPLNARDECTIYHAFREDSCEKDETLDHAKSTNGSEFNKLLSELLSNKNLTEENSLYPSDPCSIMNSSPLHMGDHKDKMGLQKSGLDVSTLVKEKATNNDVDQLLTNIEAELPGTDIVTSSEIGQNVDELMQVFKSIESGSDRLAAAGDLGAEADSIFNVPLTNLSSLEKELFNDVDVMGIAMEEQLLDGSNALKENHTKEFITTLQRKHVKLERKLDFLVRRLRKLQAKNMGQHVSEEVAGVFEHVHRTLRRAKDNTVIQSQLELTKLEPNVCASLPAAQTETTVIPERLKPISQSSAKNLVRKLEMSAHLQANSIGRQRHATRYFGSGSVESSSLRNTLVGATIIPQWTPDCKQELIRVSGLLLAETRLIQDQLDSEATVSSSGGESCDEMQTYNNPHQQYLSIQKRAAWRFATERAAIAARWDWLQAQISDLEYRIRQYTELHKQIRASKGALVLGGASPPRNVPSSPSAVNGYRGQLPGASPLSLKDPVEKCLDATANGAVSGSDPQTHTAARTRPMVNFRKRKLLQTWGLHAVSKKASRSSTMRCGCVPPHIQCALCTGRTDPTRPRDLSDYLSKSERISLLDPCFHPVYSLPEDASAGIHLEAIMKTPEWQHRSTRPNMKSIKFSSKDRTDKCNIPLEHQPKKPQQDHRRKYNRLIKSSTINALTAKIKNKFRGRKSGLHSLSRLKRKRHADKLAVPRLSSVSSDSNNVEYDQIGSATGIVKLESRSSSPLLSMQTISSYKRSSRISSYDIDNIVIPYSVAASTRVEKLQYKEILTPKWRIIDPDFATKYTSKNNGLVSGSEHDSDVEDFSEEMIAFRHEKCAVEERKKFLSYMKFPCGSGRTRSHKRTDSRAESSGCNTPDPMSPHTADSTENTVSPLTSPPATPLSVIAEDMSIPSIYRKRTVSQSRSKDKEAGKEETFTTLSENDEVVVPYDRRVFPLTEETYDKMLKLMPENHQFQTNVRAQDYSTMANYLEDVPGESPDSESTESAIGDEDPNDPEWIDMESIKDRYNRR